MRRSRQSKTPLLSSPIERNEPSIDAYFGFIREYFPAFDTEAYRGRVTGRLIPWLSQAYFSLSPVQRTFYLPYDAAPLSELPLYKRVIVSSKLRKHLSVIIKDFCDVVSNNGDSYLLRDGEIIALRIPTNLQNVFKIEFERSFGHNLIIEDEKLRLLAVKAKLSEVYELAGLDKSGADKFVHQATEFLQEQQNSQSGLSQSSSPLSELVTRKLIGPLPASSPKYKYSPRMDGGILQYLRDNWGDYIRAGVMTRPDLKRVDPPAYQALTNWLRHNTLPDDLPLLTRTAAVDNAVQAAGLIDAASRREANRLASAARRRERQPKP